MKHHSEFPLSIIQEVRLEEDWKAALLKKLRNFVERMLKFYMRGLGKLEGKDNNTGPNDPAELQFNYLPEGLRDEENPRQDQTVSRDKRVTFSTWNKLLRPIEVSLPIRGCRWMIPVLNQCLQTVKDRCQELNICLEQFMWTPCCFKDPRMFMRLESICLIVRLLKSTLFRPN